MTAVSQSYPNYLGGLNEQPDELKKPGQLVEALNVIPDSVIGLSRRPGFKELATLTGAEPGGTWFEYGMDNQLNDDYIYFGCVNLDGTVHIFNQDGVKQDVKYIDNSIIPNKKYQHFPNGYSDEDNNVIPNAFVVFDDNDKPIQIYETEDNPALKPPYLRHNTESPLKYCVSKNHIIFSNSNKVPQLDGAKEPTDVDKKRYYSFINLKVLDTANYNYIFKRFYPNDQIDTYRYITDIGVESVRDLDADYDKDLTLPLQSQGPFEFNLSPQNAGNSSESAKIKVTFVGQVVQLKSDDGDGFRNEARYSYYPTIISPGKGFRKGEIYSETLRGVNGLPNLTIRFKIEDVNTTTATKNDDITPNVTGDMTIDQILSSLQSEFESRGIDKVVIVGNGLYLENGTEFSVSTSEIAVADVINSQKLEDDVIPIARVNTVAELPVECYDGFIVQIKNSFDEKNDYYLQYNAESDSKDDVDLTKADGFWEEIAKPFERCNPQNSSLPHMITATRDSSKTNVIFVVTKISFEKRTAGISLDNPSMFIDESPITEVNYYKNRLFMFTKNGSVISSRAGEINNLFINTAINTSVVDPIDVVANSNERVPIYGSTVVNNGMVLFGNSEQYMLTTNTDILSPDTVNVTKVSNYTFEPTSRPGYLGTNIGFVSGGMPRFYEMTNLYERGPVDANERSQQIFLRFGQGFNAPVFSREQSLVMIYKRYTTEGSSDMMMYRYRQENSQDSSQTSWVQWQIGGGLPVCFVSLPINQMFVVVVDEGECKLYNQNSESLKGLPATTLVAPPKYTDGYTDNADGNKFKTIIKFPTIYAQSGSATPKSDITANLTIHRVKLSTAVIGTYDLTIERKGYDTYNLLVEQAPADEYKSEFPTLYGERVETVPIYTRNKNLTLTMSTTYDAPLTLQSMTWEGDWNRPYYKSV